MKKEMNNKGFSLVELIIVIAIMVVLIAVLAPQYLKYVEKSRVASDQTTIVEFIDAMQVIASDPEISLASTGKTYTVTVGSTGTITVSGDLTTEFTNAQILDSSTITSSKCQSTTYKEAGITLTLKYDSTNKMWIVDTTGCDKSGAVPTGASS